MLMLLAKWLVGKFQALHINELQTEDALALSDNPDPFTAFRYESPIAPSVEVFKESTVEAFPIAIVGFAVAFSVAKVYSIKHDYTIDGNQVSSM